MDGKDLLRRLRQLLDEESTGTWLDDRTSYDYLWEGAKQCARRLKSVTANQQIVTVENQANYTLNHDFMKLFMMNKQGRFFIKYSTGPNNTSLFFNDMEDIRYRDSIRTYDINQSTMTRNATTFVDIGQDFSDWETAAASDAVYRIMVTHTSGAKEWAFIGPASTTTNTDDTIAVYSDKGLTSTGWNGTSGTPSYYKIENVSTTLVPHCFSIRNKDDLYTQVTGTATSDGDDSAGKALLTDTSALFWTTDYVKPGDSIHNTTDGSTGIVLSIESTTTLYCALFGGTGNDWDSSDAYVIQPQARLELILDPPPSTSGHIIDIQYVKIPAPVYHDYGVYPFRQHLNEALVRYAAWLYKYRDSSPSFGDALYVQYDGLVRREALDLNPYIKKRQWTVNLKGRR